MTEPTARRDVTARPRRLSSLLVTVGRLTGRRRRPAAGLPTPARDRFNFEIETRYSCCRLAKGALCRRPTYRRPIFARKLFGFRKREGFSNLWR